MLPFCCHKGRKHGEKPYFMGFFTGVKLFPLHRCRGFACYVVKDVCYLVADGFFNLFYGGFQRVDREINAGNRAARGGDAGLHDRRLFASAVGTARHRLPPHRERGQGRQPHPLRRHLQAPRHNRMGVKLF